jgi:hypothetical protein
MIYFNYLLYLLLNYQQNLQICFLGENSYKLATLFWPLDLDFSLCGNLLRIDGLHFVGGFTARGEIFTVQGEKSVPVRELVQDTGQGAKRRTLYFSLILISTGIFQYLISFVCRIVWKFPAIQCNHPIVVLFHETIPLIVHKFICRRVLLYISCNDLTFYDKAVLKGIALT